MLGMSVAAIVFSIVLAGLDLDPNNTFTGFSDQPGYSTVFNGTGRPEAVLTSKQWSAIMAGTKGGDGPREVHHWEVANATVTPEWLEANQRRRDAMSRINRRNH